MPGVSFAAGNLFLFYDKEGKGTSRYFQVSDDIWLSPCFFTDNNLMKVDKPRKQCNYVWQVSWIFFIHLLFMKCNELWDKKNDAHSLYKYDKHFVSKKGISYNIFFSCSIFSRQHSNSQGRQAHRTHWRITIPEGLWPGRAPYQEMWVAVAAAGSMPLPLKPEDDDPSRHPRPLPSPASRSAHAWLPSSTPDCGQWTQDSVVSFIDLWTH